MKVILTDGREMQWPVRQSSGYAARSISLDERDLLELSKLGKDELYATVQQLNGRVHRSAPAIQANAALAPQQPKGAVEPAFDQWSMSGPEEGDTVDTTVLLCNDESDDFELFELCGDSTVGRRKASGQIIAAELNKAKATLTFEPGFEYFHFLDAGESVWRPLLLVGSDGSQDVAVCNFNQDPRIAIVMKDGDRYGKTLTATKLAELMNRFEAIPSYSSRFIEDDLEWKGIREPSKQEWVDAKEAGDMSDSFADWYAMQLRARIDEIQSAAPAGTDGPGF